VLVTDGVYDGLNNGNEDKIKEMLLPLKKETPKNIADKILNSALETDINDDMTVLVLKVSVA
jgi:serine/threonine protein phosphatase PrpC